MTDTSIYHKLPAPATLKKLRELGHSIFGNPGPLEAVIHKDGRREIHLLHKEYPEQYKAWCPTCGHYFRPDPGGYGR